MQDLTLKKRDENGREVQAKVQVLRSWQDASGRCLYLHANGVYGYKDGSPVQSENEFAVIGSPVQKEAALAWWKSTGREMSRLFYKERVARERARQGDFQEVAPADNTALDYVLYRRRETKSGNQKGAWGQPFAWMEAFSRRPDWWGQAERITLTDYEYEKTNSPDATASGNVGTDEV